MLLLLTGSSGAGKTTLARAVAGRFERLAVHDTDESGVPSNPSMHWRHANTEEWIRRALDYRADGVDLLLTGQAPLGEVLAAPSAPALDAIAVCLVDVDDAQRRHRLEARDPGRWSEGDLEAFIGWAAWHRGHAGDPGCRPEVITADSTPDMAWHRWSSWTAGDPRWRVPVLDTTERGHEECVAELEQWITEQRRARPRLLAGEAVD